MKQLSFSFVVFAVFLAFSGDALAHRVNVFAFIDAGEIHIDCRFSRSQKVKNGKLVITDADTGETLHEAITDEQGRYRYRPTDEFIRSGHGLNILLLAGEGHQADWKISADDLRTLATPSAPTDSAELEAIISKVLDEKLTPIRQALAEQKADEPGLRDIIGGIGWIIGLLGLAAYFKYRR